MESETSTVLNFNPLLYFDVFYNITDATTHDLLDSIEKTLRKNQKAFKLTKKEQDDIVKSISQNIERIIDTNNDKFELYVMRNIFNSEAIKTAAEVKSRSKKRKAEKIEESPEEITKKEQDLDAELSSLRDKICDAESKKQILDKKKARLEEDIKIIDSFTSKLSNSKSISSLYEKDKSKESPSEELLEKTKELATLVKSARMLQSSFLKSETSESSSKNKKNSSLQKQKKNVPLNNLKELNSNL